MLGELADAVRTRRVGAQELVTLALERIESLDPGIGAVVALRPEEALAEAGSMGERVARGEDPGPLAGIPCLIKDIEDLRGMRTTNGSLLFREAPPAERDGVMTTRLRAAGAIPVGKANTPEFAAEGFTANRLFGVTRNPWAPGWSPGGSSGGSGAAIAAGMVPIGTATDTGGSIRIPGAFCGLLGLKPTRGMVARDLALCWPELTTCGPLAVSVADLRALLAVEAQEPLGPGGRPKRAVAVARLGHAGPLPGPVAEAFARALEGLEGDVGLPVDTMEPEKLLPPGQPDEDWGALTGPELVGWLGRERAEASLDLMFPTTRAFVEAGLRTGEDRYRAARRRVADHARSLDAVLDGDTLIASPTLAVDGWLAEGRMPGSEEPDPPSEAYNTTVQNLTGHPAVTVPAGLFPNGVPFGLQLTGPIGADAMLLDVAEAWERARPWPVVAEGYEPFEA